MRFSPYLLVSIPAVMLVACSSQPQSMHELAETADSTTFANNITDMNSPSRKRVRTADIRCRVNNVFEVTSALEHAVLGMDGVIVESTMQNEMGMSEDLPYSADSIRHVQMYRPIANLTLRVPVSNLDSVVYKLTSMVSFIDYRTLKSQDKTFDYLSNALKNEAKDSNKSAAVTVPGKKNTLLDVKVYEDEKQETIVDRRIQNLVILDDVNYATFSVQLFQPQVADVQILVNPARATSAGFGTALMAALRDGTEIFKAVFLFFVQLWPFVLLSIAGWIGYKKYSRRKLTVLKKEPAL